MTPVLRPLRLASCAALLLAAAGCGGVYHLLKPEAEIPECCRWMEEAKAGPGRLELVGAGTMGSDASETVRPPGPGPRGGGARRATLRRT